MCLANEAWILRKAMDGIEEDRVLFLVAYRAAVLLLRDCLEDEGIQDEVALDNVVAKIGTKHYAFTKSLPNYMLLYHLEYLVLIGYHNVNNADMKLVLDFYNTVLTYWVDTINIKKLLKLYNVSMLPDVPMTLSDSKENRKQLLSGIGLRFWNDKYLVKAVHD